MDTNQSRAEFDAVVDFHGCYCLDIAMGYRVAKALVREMGEQMSNMKEIVAYTGAPTCAVDAIQKIAGCTVGKRNLIYTDVGKSVFMMQNTRTGKVLRAYCHYWDHYDHTALRAGRKAGNAPDATAEDRAAFRALLDDQVNAILVAPEQSLFQISTVTLSVPPKSSKYLSTPCDACGEHAKADTLIEREGKRICLECATKAA